MRQHFVIQHRYTKQCPQCMLISLQGTTVAAVLHVAIIVLVIFGTPIIQAFQSSIPYRYDHNRYLQRNNILPISNKNNIVALHYNSQNNHDDNNDSSSSSSSSKFETTILRHRMYPLQIQDLEQVYIRSIPNNSNISSSSSLSSSSSDCILQLIELCLYCLLHNDEPYPDAGIRFLLRISTFKWKQQIYQSIGYHNTNTNNSKNMYSTTSSTPTEQDMDLIVSTISNTITQSNNQFGILVGEGERYRISFPTEPLEYEIYNNNDDSGIVSTTTTIYVECQLRDYETNQLLVMMGWQLQKENYNENHDFGSIVASSSSLSSYMIDRVDWQDFREHFRPGIGREEWMRICG